MSWTDAAIEELARRFAAAAIPRPEWSHEAHLVMGAWHVHTLGAAKALEALRARWSPMIATYARVIVSW